MRRKKINSKKISYTRGGKRCQEREEKSKGRKKRPLGGLKKKGKWTDYPAGRRMSQQRPGRFRSGPNAQEKSPAKGNRKRKIRRRRKNKVPIWKLNGMRKEKKGERNMQSLALGDERLDARSRRENEGSQLRTKSGKG